MAHFLWTQKEDIGPSPRFGHAMCYEIARQRTFLFGGAAAGLLNDSWIWIGDSWTQLADTGPSARRDHSMCFDSARGHVVLFGGVSNNDFQGDTWIWDGDNWTQVEDSGPAARVGHRLAFDAVRSRVVLFGGEARSGLLNDTWEWDGNAWTQMADSGPSPRSNYAFAYDLTQQTTVLFGGENVQGSTFGDTWAWKGGNWTQVQDIGPPARARASMVSTDAQLILLGGLSSSAPNEQPTLFGDSWVFQSGQWTERQDMGPAPRWGHAMAFDTQRRTVVLFGGHSSAAVDQGGDLLRDTWEHLETEPATTQSGQQSAGSQLAQLTLNPSSASPGQQVTAEVTLANTSLSTTILTMVWILQSVVDNASNTNAPVNQSDIHLLGQLQIPAGLPGAVFGFVAPTASEPVVVFAYDANESVGAQLTIL